MCRSPLDFIQEDKEFDKMIRTVSAALEVNKKTAKGGAGGMGGGKCHEMTPRDLNQGFESSFKVTL